MRAQGQETGQPEPKSAAGYSSHWEPETLLLTENNLFLWCGSALATPLTPLARIQTCL